MPETTVQKVAEFHDKFGYTILEKPDVSDVAHANFRAAFLQEELDELKEAIAKQDIVEVLDALTDLQYLLDGAYLAFGLSHLKEKAFQEVHASNMSKTAGTNTTKSLKGPNYFRPNLTQFFVNE